MSRYNFTTSGMKESPDGPWVSIEDFDELWKANRQLVDDATYGGNTEGRCRILSETLRLLVWNIKNDAEAWGRNSEGVAKATTIAEALLAAMKPQASGGGNV